MSICEFRGALLACVFLGCLSGELHADNLTAHIPTGGGNIAIVGPWHGRSAYAITLDFKSPSGSLIPLPGGMSASADPFQFLLSNDQHSVAYSSLAISVEFEADSCTLISLQVEPGADDVSFSWGGGASPIGGLTEIRETVCVPEPTGAWPLGAALLMILGGSRRRRSDIQTRRAYSVKRNWIRVQGSLSHRGYEEIDIWVVFFTA